MSDAPLAYFFGAPVVEIDGWSCYRGRAGVYASRDDATGLDLTDPAVPPSVRHAFTTWKDEQP